MANGEDVGGERGDDRRAHHHRGAAVQPARRAGRRAWPLTSCSEVVLRGPNPYLSDYARKYYDDGEAKGETNGVRAALLTVITARDIPLGDGERARIEACADLTTLDAWLARAARARSAGEIFAD